MMPDVFQEYETRILRTFNEMFAGAGFDAQRDIAGIILNRWGHAYLAHNQVFLRRTVSRTPREILRNAPFGRIAFANTTWRSYGPSLFHTGSQTAVEQLARPSLT